MTEEADAILGLAAGGRKPVHGPLGLRVVPGQWLAPGLWRFPGKGAIHPQEEPTRLTPGFWTVGFPSCDSVHFCCLKPPGLR